MTAPPAAAATVEAGCTCSPKLSRACSTSWLPFEPSLLRVGSDPATSATDGQSAAVTTARSSTSRRGPVGGAARPWARRHVSASTPTGSSMQEASW